MSVAPSCLDDLPALLEAVAFAARAHVHQLRKDGRTPYISHVVRVCLIARHVFGIDDTPTLIAALLHDTIEDTTTDYDDIAERFGTDVADWVGLLTKDSRLVEAQREDAYCARLATAPWQVKICKLADVYDNLTDSATSAAPETRRRVMAKARKYLDAIANDLPSQVQRSYQIVNALLDRETSQPEAQATDKSTKSCLRLAARP
jgi:guanosine-3',5'-bis(diphosphate) 3'-pyrophosphohydrolase